MDGPSGSTSQFSRACRNCATAKTKCVTRPSLGNDCERCHRLKRVCVRDAPTARKRKPPTAKNARLEQKLDQLVTLLANNQQHQSSTSATPELPNTSTSSQHAVEPEASNSNNNGRESRPSPPITGELGAVFAARPPRIHKPDAKICDPTVDLTPDDKEAERCLTRYQTHMFKYFPFVVIPPGTTIATLRTYKPFLLKVIVTIASYQDLTRQREMGTGLTSYVAHQLLMRGEKSLDLLQGLLVWLGWFHPHFFANPQTTMLLQLAVGLVIDLGLKRSARAYGNERIDTAVTRSAHGDLANSELRTSEERRAILGCFYLTTIVAQWAKRYESMRFTAQLEEVCCDLENAREYPSDRYLIELVRIQRLVQRIERKCPVDDLTPAMPVPVAMFVLSLHGEIKEARRSLPPDLAQDTMLLMHYYSAEIYLYELSLSSLPESPQYSDFTYRRLTMFNALMQSATTFISYYQQLPISTYYDLPFVHTSQLTLATIVLSKLSRLNFPGWDLEYAQAYINFPTVMEDMARRYEEARSESDVPIADNPLFTYLARKLRFIASWNEAKLKGIEKQQPPKDPERLHVGGPAPEQPQIPVEQIPELNHEDMWDPNFWQEFLGDMSALGNMQGCWSDYNTLDAYPGQ